MPCHNPQGPPALGLMAHGLFFLNHRTRYQSTPGRTRFHGGMELQFRLLSPLLPWHIIVPCHSSKLR